MEHTPVQMPVSSERVGFIAIVGKPNVGKSSLLNALLGEKVAIVTAKPQTTRTRIMGVLTEGDDQYVFLDTPGLHQAKNKLGTQMVQAVRGALLDTDLVIFIVEAQRKNATRGGDPAFLSPAELEILGLIKQRKLKTMLVINKIDLMKDRAALAPRIMALSQLYEFEAIVPVSVQKNDGVTRVLGEAQKHLTQGTHCFPADTLTDQPERVLAAERIREQILTYMHEEIPHGIAVVIEKMKERGGKKDLLEIHAVIYCERKTHKGMLIGKQGATLKRIATAAREDLEAFFDTQVHLECFVKVKEDWRNTQLMIDQFGL